MGPKVEKSIEMNELSESKQRHSPVTILME